MSDERTPLLRSPLLQKGLKLGTAAAILFAVLALPTALLLASQSRSVQYISGFDEATIEVNRFTFEDDEDQSDSAIVAIYGAVSGEPEDVLFVAADRIIRPRENPSLALLAKAATENPLQVQTVWFLARAVTLGAALAALAGLALLFYLRRRRLAGHPAVA